MLAFENKTARICRRPARPALRADKEAKQLNSLDRQLRNASGKSRARSRTGGGHVTLYESEDAHYYYCRGGSNVTKIPKSRPINAIRWRPIADRWPQDGRNRAGRECRERARPSSSPPLLG